MSSEDQTSSEAVNGIAFLLLTEAFLDYVEAFAAIDPERGQQLLADAKDRAVATLSRFVRERPDAGSPDVLLAAAARVHSVFAKAGALNAKGE